MTGKFYDEEMKILAGLIFLLIVVGSVVADYFWKRWIEKQRRNRLP